MLRLTWLALRTASDFKHSPNAENTPLAWVKSCWYRTTPCKNTFIDWFSRATDLKILLNHIDRMLKRKCIQRKSPRVLSSNSTYNKQLLQLSHCKCKLWCMITIYYIQKSKCQRKKSHKLHCAWERYPWEIRERKYKTKHFTHLLCQQTSNWWSSVIRRCSRQNKTI